MKNILVLLGLVLSITLFGQEMKEIENLISSERFDDAGSLLNDLKNKEPNNPYLFYLSGENTLKSYISDPYSESRSTAIKKAKKFFSEGVKSDSLNPLNYVGIGMIELFKSNDSLRADYYFSRANDLIPRKSKRLFGSGTVNLSDLQIMALLKLETAELYSNSPRYYKSDLYNKILVELKPLLPSIYIAYGDIKLAERDASEAIILYKKALYLEKTALSNYLVAKIYALARNNFEARKYYEQALTLDSTFAPAYSGLGDLYYKDNKPQRAKINYAHYLRLTGNNIAAKINYVKALYKAKDYNGVVENAADILKADSTKTYLLRLASYSLVDKKNPDMAKALLYMQKFVYKTPEDELITKDYIYYSKILLALKRDSNDINNGFEMLEKAYAIDSSNNEILVDLIKTSYHYKLYDKEIKYIVKKISFGDNNANLITLLGKAYFYNKEYRKADSTFGLITAKDSLDFEAWKWRSNAMMAQDPDLKLGLAKPAFEKILLISGKDSGKYLKERYEALSYLGSYYMFTSEVDLNKAIYYLKESIAMKISDPEKKLKAYYALGFAYYKSKQWINAKAAYEIVLKLKPDDEYAPKALNEINKYLAGNK